MAQHWERIPTWVFFWVVLWSSRVTCYAGFLWIVGEDVGRSVSPCYLVESLTLQRFYSLRVSFFFPSSISFFFFFKEKLDLMGLFFFVPFSYKPDTERWSYHARNNFTSFEPNLLSPRPCREETRQSTYILLTYISLYVPTNTGLYWIL